MLTIDETTTVRAMLAAYPQTFSILVEHGMCAECKADPPPVSLGRFATKHCGGDVAGLIDQLRRAAGAPPA